MSNNNETTYILAAETHDKLIKSIDAEVLKLLRLRLVLKIVARINVDDIHLIFSENQGNKEIQADRENIARALKILSIKEYLHLKGTENECVLNLRNLSTISLSYTERKAIRQHLPQCLASYLQPIAVLGRKIRTEIPSIEARVATASADVVADKQINTTTLKRNYFDEVINLVKQRCKNLSELATLRARKCAFLKAAAELKVGPYLVNEVELLYAQARLNQLKASLLRSYMLNDLINRNEHSYKAIKEVEEYIDNAIKKL